MKLALLAAVVATSALFTTPAFADEPAADENPAVTEQAPQGQQEDLSRPHIWTCVARDWYGYAYWYQAWWPRVAANGAMNTCRWYSTIGFCRLQGCY